MIEGNYINPIFVAGPIDRENFYKQFMARFSELMQKTKSGDTITVLINSGGGETHTALAIYDLLKSTDRTCVGVVAGVAQSGASLILQACDKRLITENSHMMLHRSNVQVSGKIVDAQSNLNTFKSLDDKFYEIYAQKAGERVEKISEMASQDKHFNAVEALGAGLVDEIIKAEVKNKKALTFINQASNK
ncbi:MAG: hypothetical protein AMXMBFR44_4610 [Candidatus Campbellbacteria bacterium]